jgi:hypothetical protein
MQNAKCKMQNAKCKYWNFATGEYANSFVIAMEVCAH